MRHLPHLIVPALAVAMWACATPGARAAEWFVAPGGSGSGSAEAPFGRIQDGLSAAQPGDTVTVESGTYAERVVTVRRGTREMPITLRAARGRGSVLVTFPGRVLDIDHASFIVDGLTFDGQYGAADTLTVRHDADYLILRDTEVRRSARDLIDIADPTGVLIENCIIHHALNAAGGRTDAHGIAAGAVQDLTIRNTDIHTFSGDGVQVDPGRAAPGWNRVTIEGTRIWLAPLPTAENGFAAGVVPGENAVDTKAGRNWSRSSMTIRDTEAWGFRGGLITNMAAFNLKENVDVTVDRVTVHDSEIAFRLRGQTNVAAGAWVAIANAVVYNTSTAFRYENNIDRLHIWNSTVGRGVGRVFQAASSTAVGLEVRNVLVLGGLPAEAAHPSNLGAGPATFADAAGDDYRLPAGSPAIDIGSSIAEVTADRAGVTRPQGGGYDIGAYERPAQ